MLWLGEITNGFTALIPTTNTNTFSYLDAGGEQIIFTITGSIRKYLKCLTLDLSNMTQDGTIKLYLKIDGINYRQINNDYTFTVLTDSDGYLINVTIPIYGKDFKITYTEGADEGAARNIPYTYVLEG